MSNDDKMWDWLDGVLHEPDPPEGWRPSTLAGGRSVRLAENVPKAAEDGSGLLFLVERCPGCGAIGDELDRPNCVTDYGNHFPVVAWVHEGGL